jgi:hypothetical protein
MSELSGVMLTYEEAYQWVDGTESTKRPCLLLGNGFSVAFDAKRFSYRALRDSAEDSGYIGKLARKLFSTLNTFDFELVIRQLLDAARALEILDASGHAVEIAALRAEAADLKDGLAHTLADLHPERPGDIGDEAYARVRAFIDRHERIYSANYDLLLYWTLMHDEGIAAGHFTASDDGFRNSDNKDAEYVVWNYLSPHDQTVFYLHGALHLYRDEDNGELQKLTWIRTGKALLDQIRKQLAANHFPLIVAEGTSSEKLARIQTSDYLSRGLRSLASTTGGLLCFGLSMSANDEHILRAITKSRVKRLAVSVYGDPHSPENGLLRAAASRLQAARSSVNPKVPLDIQFFDASSTPLW